MIGHLSVGDPLVSAEVSKSAKRLLCLSFGYQRDFELLLYCGDEHLSGELAAAITSVLDRHRPKRLILQEAAE